MVDPKHQIDRNKIVIPSIKRRRTIPSFNKCNIKSCKDIARSRGVCGLHYFHARLLIREGLMTDDQAVSLGILNQRKNTTLNSSPYRKDLLNIINKKK